MEHCPAGRLAVWRAKPEVVISLEDWAFAPEHYAAGTGPPEEGTPSSSVESGVQAATAPTRGWIQQIARQISELHRDNSISADTPIIPQLVIGDFISSGSLNSVEDVGYLLSQKLHMSTESGK